MNDTYIWIMIIATVLGLAVFLVFLHYPNGIKQKTTIYGHIYFTKTILYLNGINIKEWSDASYTKGQVKQAKEEMYKEAKQIYDNLTHKKNDEV